MTRWLTEKCNCGEYKEMYNTPVCFKCEKPEVGTIETLDLLTCMRYIERKYDFPELTAKPYTEGTSRKLWLLMGDSWTHNNDSYTWIPIDKFLSEPGAWVKEITDPEVIRFVQLMIDEFNLNNIEVQWYVSY